MKVVNGEDMRKIDTKAIVKFKIPSIDLMENAGKGVVDFLKQEFPDFKKKKICILCGKGNNGGDGLVIARWLTHMKVKVRVFLFAKKEELKKDVKINLNKLLKEKVTVNEVANFKDLAEIESEIKMDDIIIDALLGTGFTGAVTGLLAKLIDYVNTLETIVVSVDLPSGLNANNGQVISSCIKADYTVTLGIMKVGTLIYPGASYTGKLIVKDIGIPKDLIESDDIQLNFIVKEDLLNIFPKRIPDCNKGSAGKVLIIGGSVGLTGAPCLAGLSALRTGCGLVTLGIPASLNDIIEVKLTEVISKPLPENSNRALGLNSESYILNMSKNHDVLVLGPGLGRDKETGQLVRNLIREIRIPVVLDADGLNLISGNVSVLKNKKAPFILTPHPGEMSRLANITIEDVQSNRIEVARDFAKKYNVILILKGARTVVAHPAGNVFINSTGNSGLATAGTGDVLTGMIAGIIAQGVNVLNGSMIGVYLHGLAGDMARESKTEYGMIASDVVENIPKAIKEIMKDIK
ncbi:MAG: NAD(P)H-hydrate dehydratase [Candidatus Firestonebacteria bacterium]